MLKTFVSSAIDGPLSAANGSIIGEFQAGDWIRVAGSAFGTLAYAALIMSAYSKVKGGY